MKKIYLFLVLIIAFILLPQFSFADIVVAPNEGLDYNSVNRSSLSCLRRKKQKIKNYQGSNLKLKRGKLFREKVYSGQSYYLSSESQTPTLEESILGDCKDYIVFGTIGEGESKISLYYDVTEVPPNSFLKYVSDTQELQVFPPREAPEEEPEEEEEEEIQEGTTVDVSEDIRIAREMPIEVKTKKATPAEVTPEPEPESVPEVNFVKPSVQEQLAAQEPEESSEPQKKPHKNILFMLSFAFFLAAFIEGIITLLFFGLDWKLLGVVAGVNLLTNPILNLIIFRFNITSNGAVLVLDLFVMLIEFGILALYMRKNYIKLAIFVVLANAASYFVGTYLVNMQFWWDAINKI